MIVKAMHFVCKCHEANKDKEYEKDTECIFADLETKWNLRRVQIIVVGVNTDAHSIDGNGRDRYIDFHGRWRRIPDKNYPDCVALRKEYILF